MNNQNIVYPDYNHSILNIINSILKKYNVETGHNSLKILDDIIEEKKYKTIALIILDGLGNNLLVKHSKDGILNKNKVDVVTSVFPSTTTAAMTTYYSGKTPLETGHIAWSQYFKEYGISIDVLIERNTYTGERIKNDSKLKEILKYDNIFELIENKNPNIKTYEVMPKYCEKKYKREVIANNIEEVCDVISSLSNNEKEEKFIFAYLDNPDELLHKYGCNSIEVMDFIKNVESNIEKMLKDINNSDTLIIISADHGHNDIENTYRVLEDEEIQECLILEPTLESRVVNFYVKPEKINIFKEIFERKYGSSFYLYSKKQMLEGKLLGEGNKHRKIDDFLGDFIAVSYSNDRILIENYLNKERRDRDYKKSTHCGLTENEMNVPLIVVKK